MARPDLGKKDLNEFLVEQRYWRISKQHRGRTGAGTCQRVSRTCVAFPL